MKIALDASKAINEKAGVARYTWEIASNLPRFYPQDEFFYYFNFMRGGSDKRKLINQLIGHGRNITYKIYKVPGAWKERLFTSPFSLSNLWIKGSDIFHAPEFLSFDCGLKIPQILTVHDLTMLKFPQHRPDESQRHGQMLRRACQQAQAIIAVSRATKKDIVDYWQIDPHKITVTHLGYNPIFKKITNQSTGKKILKKYRINFPFLLFVGTIEPRKNISHLLLAFDQFSHTAIGQSYHLLLVGKKGWNTREIEQTYQSLQSTQKIHWLDFVPDEELIYLYNQASLFCYPSLYEGFGLPVLEAMACGAPVLTANISSLPEVGGQAAVYINPQNYQEIYQAMKKILSDTKYVREMSKKSLEQAKKFSWIKTVRATHRVYHDVLKGKYESRA